MHEKDLILKLKNLQQIEPDQAWKARNREILLAQISGGSEDKLTSFFNIFDKLLPAKVLMMASRPVMVFLLIIAILVGGGAVSIYASAKTKPGDSLYIAKIISEKTQLAMAFNDNDKTKLNLEFAANRTQEITQVISDADNQKAATVAGLTSDFKSEISAARSRLSKAVSSKPSIAPTNDANNNKPIASQPGDDQSVKVFDAEAGRDASGLQLSDQVNQLNDAEQLFDKQDYAAAISKINEVTKNIDKPASDDSGIATTTTAKVGATSTIEATSSVEAKATSTK